MIQAVLLNMSYVWLLVLSSRMTALRLAGIHEGATA
jgi:hypothetical protein